MMRVCSHNYITIINQFIANASSVESQEENFVAVKNLFVFLSGRYSKCDRSNYVFNCTNSQGNRHVFKLAAHNEHVKEGQKGRCRIVDDSQSM